MTDTENQTEKIPVRHRDWTRGSIVSNLLLLSWPMVLMESLYVFSQVIDMVWVGRLGPAAIAGVGIANIVIMLVMSMDMGIIVGVRALVARFIGAGDYPGANHVAAQAIILSVAWGLLMTLLGLATAGPILDMFGLEADVISQALDYMIIMFAGWIAMDVLVMGLYIIQSSGDTIRPLWIEAFARVIHVALCPFLVLGLWVFPQMGVGGAALSNVISQAVGAVLGLVILFSGRTRLHLSRKDFSLDIPMMWRILKIGLPALVMNMQRSFGNFIVTWLIAPFGTTAVAAHSLAIRIQMFVFLPGMGLGMGAGVLVGQNLGAGQPERAKRSAWLAVGLVEAFMLVCSLVLLLWPEAILGIFTRNADLLELGSAFVRIAVSGFIVLGFVSVLQNAIAGAGDTVPNMIISIATIWLVSLPLSFFLSRYTPLGVLGIRWGLAAVSISGTMAYILYFRTGRWMHKKV